MKYLAVIFCMSVLVVHEGYSSATKRESSSVDSASDSDSSESSTYSSTIMDVPLVEILANETSIAAYLATIKPDTSAWPTMRILKVSQTELDETLIWAIARAHSVTDCIKIPMLNTLVDGRKALKNPQQVREFMSLYCQAMMRSRRELHKSFLTYDGVLVSPCSESSETCARFFILSETAHEFEELPGRPDDDYMDIKCSEVMMEHFKLVKSYVQFLSRHAQGLSENSSLVMPLHFKPTEFLEKLNPRLIPSERELYQKVISYFGHLISMDFTHDDKFDDYIRSKDRFHYFVDENRSLFKRMKVAGAGLSALDGEHALKATSGVPFTITMDDGRQLPVIVFDHAPLIPLSDEATPVESPKVELIYFKDYAKMMANYPWYEPFESATTPLSPYLRKQIYSSVAILSGIFQKAQMTSYNGFFKLDDLPYISTILSRFVVLRIWAGVGQSRKISIEINRKHLWFDGDGNFGCIEDFIDTPSGAPRSDEIEAMSTPDLTIPMFGMEVAALIPIMDMFISKNQTNPEMKWWDCVTRQATHYQRLSEIMSGPYGVIRASSFPVSADSFKNPYSLGMHLLLLSGIGRWVRNLRDFEDRAIQFGAVADQYGMLGEIALQACIKSFAHALSSCGQYRIQASQISQVLWRFYGALASVGRQGRSGMPINPRSFDIVDAKDDRAMTRFRVSYFL